MSDLLPDKTYTINLSVGSLANQPDFQPLRDLIQELSEAGDKQAEALLEELLRLKQKAAHLQDRGFAGLGTEPHLTLSKEVLGHLSSRTINLDIRPKQFDEEMISRFGEEARKVIAEGRKKAFDDPAHLGFRQRFREGWVQLQAKSKLIRLKIHLHAIHDRILSLFRRAFIP
jgi:hypothetical protein